MSASHAHSFALREPRVLIRSFVGELFAWNASVVRVERVAHGSQSPIVGIIAVLELGVIGTGCRGTKGVGRKPTEEADPRGADPIGSTRYRSLGRVHQITADAVIADGHGDREVEQEFGDRKLWLPLPERIGFRLSSERQVHRWSKKIRNGDSRPALDGARTVGLPALLGAARQWFSAGNQ